MPALGHRLVTAGLGFRCARKNPDRISRQVTAGRGGGGPARRKRAPAHRRERLGTMRAPSPPARVVVVQFVTSAVMGNYERRNVGASSRPPRRSLLCKDGARARAFSARMAGPDSREPVGRSRASAPSAGEKGQPLGRSAIVRARRQKALDHLSCAPGSASVAAGGSERPAPDRPSARAASDRASIGERARKDGNSRPGATAARDARVGSIVAPPSSCPGSFRQSAGRRDPLPRARAHKTPIYAARLCPAHLVTSGP